MRVWIVISQRGGWNGGPVNMQSLMLLASGCDLAHAPNTTRILFVYSALCFTTCNLRSTLCTVSNSALRWFLSAWFLVSKGTDVISSVLDLFLQCSPHLMSHDTCRWASLPDPQHTSHPNCTTSHSLWHFLNSCGHHSLLMHLSMLCRGGVGGVGEAGYRVGIWWFCWSWGRAFDWSCSPGGGDIWIFLRST